MADRLIDVRVSNDISDRFRDTIRELDSQCYEFSAGDDHTVFRLVVPADRTEAFLDELGADDLDEGKVRAIVLAVAALSPRLEIEEEEADDEKGEEDEKRGDRVSREELYDTISDGARVGPTYLYMTALAALVAAIGMSRDNSAVVIGAMVIAPLLGPNMAWALATTLADGKLLGRALLANAIGVGLTLVVAALCGLIWGLDLQADEVAGRTDVTLGEIALALASGAAGAIAATQGARSTLVGVMVAVSLMPPLVMFPMLLVQGHAQEAGRAALLVGGNLVCLNLAAITVFRLRGIRPRTWYEEKRSRNLTIKALVAWLLLLAGVIAMVVFTGAAAEQKPDDAQEQSTR